MEETIIEILKELDPYIEIDVGTKLIEDQILDSLSIILLINVLEEKYGIEIPLDSLKVEDFETVSIATIKNGNKRGRRLTRVEKQE